MQAMKTNRGVTILTNFQSPPRKEDIIMDESETSSAVVVAAPPPPPGTTPPPPPLPPTPSPSSPPLRNTRHTVWLRVSGVPGCGKTSFAKHLKNELLEENVCTLNIDTHGNVQGDMMAKNAYKCHDFGNIEQYVEEATTRMTEFYEHLVGGQEERTTTDFEVIVEILHPGFLLQLVQACWSNGYISNEAFARIRKTIFWTMHERRECLRDMCNNVLSSFKFLDLFITDAQPFAFENVCRQITPAVGQNISVIRGVHEAMDQLLIHEMGQKMLQAREQFHILCAYEHNRQPTSKVVESIFLKPTMYIKRSLSEVSPLHRLWDSPEKSGKLKLDKATAQLINEHRRLENFRIQHEIDSFEILDELRRVGRQMKDPSKALQDICERMEECLFAIEDREEENNQSRKRRRNSIAVLPHQN